MKNTIYASDQRRRVNSTFWKVQKWSLLTWKTQAPEEKLKDMLKMHSKNVLVSANGEEADTKVSQGSHDEEDIYIEQTSGNEQ